MEQLSMSELWPPPYSMRVSQRTRRIHLLVSHDKGLELVVPPNTSEKVAIDFLHSKRRWIERHANIIQKAGEEKTVPDLLTLHGLRSTWQIRYESVASAKRIKLISMPQQLVLYGKVDEYQSCVAMLSNWVKEQADTHLSKWLDEISCRLGLSYDGVTVRGQKTRWGSCSKECDITLNYKLLFLPYPLIEYVLIHELCHTVYLNHSKRFWNLVKKHVPDYMALRKELRKPDLFIPDWGF